MLTIRKAELCDLSDILEIYETAKASLRAMGVDQWQDGYPNEGTAIEDIENNTSYLLEENGETLATACLAFGHEQTYDVIYDGTWLCNESYGFLHRVAVSESCKGKGAVGIFFNELVRQAGERGIGVLRGDTHRDNASMQRAMVKNGFMLRGRILLEDGSDRLAYERVLL